MSDYLLESMSKEPVDLYPCDFCGTKVPEEDTIGCEQCGGDFCESCAEPGAHGCMTEEEEVN